MYFEVETWAQAQAIGENWTINHIEYDNARCVYCIEAY